MGLVSEGDRDRLEERHVLDSVRALRCLGPGPGLVVDMGSGAGLPGVPLAILRGDRSFVLIDRRRKAAAFMELVVEELALSNVRILEQDLRSVRIQAEVCLARALAPVEGAWGVAERLLEPGGHLVYWAGSGWRKAHGGPREAAKWEICVQPLFSWQGPLVIMKRPEPTPKKESHHEA
jgi:16S rRNA (guanine527-N7)-methyltransferase